MLTFLRKIRKSLIDSSSGQKYLLYAIGEIALVVIGILIALQINEWSQDTQNKKYEKEYLERLIMDIDRDSFLVSFVEKELEKKKDRLHTVRMYLDDPTIIMNDSIKTLMLESSTLGTDLPNARLTATYQEILSSGHLRLIRNTNLRNAITNYYSIWDHEYYRIEKKQSDYPSLVLQIVDRGGEFDDNPINAGKALTWTLSFYDIEPQFRLNFMKEVNYMVFTKQRIQRINRNVISLKSKILEELHKLN